MKLGSGSVVEFDRTISEPVDLVVQGLTVARGEVVVVGDSFAIRIKDVISPQG
ncbi:MAG: FliM/FliN family flagellar motor switch protein [Planctomycetota bacterium]|nr:FliM/FliN family flagellar motor switch protein [Planctomycetota bacterium]